MGTLAINTEPDRGQLWRIDADGSAHRKETGVHVSNGLGFSPDGATFYFTDSGRRTIYAFDLEAGEIAGRRVFVELQPHEGIPDGLTVDAEGGVWTALWDGWTVRRYAADGRLDRTVTLPVPRPTSCTFGGGPHDALRDQRTHPVVGPAARGRTAVGEPVRDRGGGAGAARRALRRLRGQVDGRTCDSGTAKVLR